MEDVLELYEQSCDMRNPSVCFDESPYQLIGEKRTVLPAEPGRPLRYDYEYQRNGTVNLFICFEPLAGQRHIEITDRRTKADFARMMKMLSDEIYQNADKIRIVMDNLNTHNPSSLYEVSEPAEARRILRRLEFHYTPKHASWLNMAEIELSVLSGQCTGRRISNTEILRQEVSAWERERNRQNSKVIWRFTNTDARIKLKRLYPS